MAHGFAEFPMLKGDIANLLVAYYEVIRESARDERFRPGLLSDAKWASRRLASSLARCLLP